MAVHSCKHKHSADRVPLKTEIAQTTAWSRQSRCRSAIKKHHELLKHDPERLTTEFMIDITGCKCNRQDNRTPDAGGGK